MTTTTFLPNAALLPLWDPALTPDSALIKEIFEGPTAITPEADSLTGVTDPGFNVPEELLPSTYVIEAGETMRENGWNTLGQGVENVGQVMRSFGFDEAEDDLGGPTLDKIAEAIRTNDAKAVNRLRMTPANTTSQIIHEKAVQTRNDPNASVGDKILHTVADVAVQANPMIGKIKAVENFFSAIGNWTGWWDEDEEDIPAFRDEFSSNPQTLTPIDLNSAMVTDAYQHQNAPGADLIAGEANQGMDPFQAQRVQYEVLA